MGTDETDIEIYEKFTIVNPTHEAALTPKPFNLYYLILHFLSFYCRTPIFVVDSEKKGLLLFPGIFFYLPY